MVDEARVRELEVRINQIDNKLALSSNDAVHREKDFEDLKKRIDGLQSGINKLLWAGGLLVLTAFGNFIINGGLGGIGT